VDLYEAIRRSEVNRNTVRDFLTQEGKKLAVGGADYYYEVRERFNDKGSPFDFLSHLTQTARCRVGT
jgi:DNA adenine methylase